jgi:hypothetical protein
MSKDIIKQNALEHAFLIKGYFTAHNAPKPVRDALESIITILRLPSEAEITRSQQPGFKAEHAGMPFEKVTDLMSFTREKAIEETKATLTSKITAVDQKIVATAVETIGMLINGDADIPQTDDDAQTDSGDAPQSKKRTTETWTDEQLRQLVKLVDQKMPWKDIAGKVEHSKGSCYQRHLALRRKNELDKFREPKPITGSMVWGKKEEKPAHVDVPAEKLISDHAEYAGVREDGILHDADWGDIKPMIMSGKSAEDMAALYGVSLDSMQRFIERMQLHKKPDAPAGANPNEEKISYMRSLRKMGKTDHEIAQAIGLTSHHSVAMLLREPKTPKPVFRTKHVPQKPDATYNFGGEEELQF